MSGEAALLLAEIGAAHLALLAAVAFVAATVSGMSGVGGGLLLAIFIAPLVGVKAVVPTVGVATLIAHVARVWVYRERIVWRPALVMLAGAIPATIASARLYVALPADAIALILGVFLLGSIPLRRLMARRELRFGARSLGLIGATYGFLSGTTIGGGILVIPALLGAGLAGLALLATDAVIGLSVLTAKTMVFGGFDVLTRRLLVIGCLLGACMIPGTYFARWLVVRTPLHVHIVAMEVIVILGAGSFLWRAFAGS
jgi:uncharacterized membrane protein YfcA